MSISEKLEKVAENVPKVYEAGRAYEKGYTDGIKAEYDTFWDNYQENGERTIYQHAFGGCGWTEETFKPKYNIIPTNAYMLFYNNDKITDLVCLLKKNKVTLDLSNARSIQYAFGNSSITKIGIVDTTQCVSLQNCFVNSTKLVEIEKIILKDDGSQGYTTPFNGCTSLEKVIFQGTIGQDGLNMQWSTKLNKSSITSIINALSETTSGLSITLSKTAVDNAGFGEDGDQQIHYPYTETTKTENGITFTDNGDGTITLNGTATAEATFIIWRDATMNEDTQYTISGIPNNVPSGSVVLEAKPPFIDYGGGYTGISNTYENSDVTIKVSSGAQLNNVVINPKLYVSGTSSPHFASLVGSKENWTINLV